MAGKKGDVLITVVLDRSGSMYGLKDDTIGGFNGFLAEQRALKNAGKARLTLVQFDHEYQVDLVAEPLDSVPPLDELSYVPRGMTALFDATHRALDESEDWSRQHGWKGKHIVIIITDGIENASREHPVAKDLKRRVKGLEAEGWVFGFLGVGLEKFHSERELGVSSSSLVPQSVAGVAQGYTQTSTGVTQVRTGQGGSGLYDDPSKGKGKGGK